ncbi:MAG: hypothetical protein U1F56_08685 [Rubrivivax sp.]
MIRRHALAAVGTAACATPADAQVQLARRWAVLSEAAREIQIVIERPSIGSNLQQNLVQASPIKGGVLDRVALAAARAELKRAEPVAVLRSIEPLDTDLFDARADFARGSVPAMPSDLADALRQLGSTHLLLVTRHRTDAAFQILTGRVGNGRVEGVGFYVDNHTPVNAVDSNVVGRRGYLAPFAALRASVLALPEGRVVASRTVLQAEPVPAGEGAGSTHPWDTLDAAQKMRALADAIEQALQQLVPALLADLR